MIAYTYRSLGLSRSVLVFFGVLVYRIARGQTMRERAARRGEEQEEALRQYVREAAAPNRSSTAYQMSTPAALAVRGTVAQ